MLVLLEPVRGHKCQPDIDAEPSHEAKAGADRRAEIRRQDAAGEESESLAPQHDGPFGVVRIRMYVDDDHGHRVIHRRLDELAAVDLYAGVLQTRMAHEECAHESVGN